MGVFTELHVVYNCHVEILPFSMWHSSMLLHSISLHQISNADMMQLLKPNSEWVDLIWRCLIDEAEPDMWPNGYKVGLTTEIWGSRPKLIKERLPLQSLTLYIFVVISLYFIQICLPILKLTKVSSWLPIGIWNKGKKYKKIHVVHWTLKMEILGKNSH